VPRQRRIQIAGLCQHVIQRGTDRCSIFRALPDYELFIAALREASVRHGVDVHAYVLMTNHVHLVVSPHRAHSVSRAMQSIGRRYVRYFNEQHRRTGALFEGRYRSTIIDSDAYWVACARYVELNPVRAGIVRRPEAYPWSSYGANAFGMPDGVLTPHRVYMALADTPEERQRCWRSACAEETLEDQLDVIRRAVHRGGVLGKLKLPKEGQP
jgi:putative transposase